MCFFFSGSFANGVGEWGDKGIKSHEECGCWEVEKLVRQPHGNELKWGNENWSLEVAKIARNRDVKSTERKKHKEESLTLVFSIGVYAELRGGGGGRVANNKAAECGTEFL